MRHIIHGHRYADVLFTSIEPYRTLLGEVFDTLDEIDDEMVVNEFVGNRRRAKSISQALNRLIKAGLTDRGWESESFIFADERYADSSKGIWRLDFAKEPLCVEVAFNHRSDIAWNLIKPTLASELNHVEKAVQTGGGMVIAATEELKSAGGFDSAVGTYEDYVQYLKPLSQMLTAPLLIVGLLPPETFRIEFEDRNGRKIGHVVTLAKEEVKHGED
jgi:hypothetical protein